MLTPHRGVPLRYAVDRAALAPSLRDTFVELHADDDTRAFVDEAFERPTSALRLSMRSAARSIMSDYDANALFDTHAMHVLSSAQWSALLGRRFDRWLDVGSGDGKVTATLTSVAATIVTTETSERMAARLRERGFACHGVDLATTPLAGEAAFDVVSALNVLDRTARPYTLVEAMLRHLAPFGLLVLAVPLPLAPHVHVRGGTVDPDELLPIDRRGFESAASTLVDVALAPLGLVPLAATRVPYLSRGDAVTRVHVLDDFVVVLRRASEPQALST